MVLKRYYKFIDNFVSFSLYKVIDAIIPILLIPHFLKIVGTQNYGIYAFAFALILYLVHVLSYGFTLSAVRELSINRDNNEVVNSIYNKVFTTQLYLFLFVTSILLLLIGIVEVFRANYLVYLFFIPMLAGILLTPTWFFLGVEKMRFITIINLVSKIVFVLLALFLIKKETHYVYISLFQSIGYMISGIAAQIIIFRSFKIKLLIVPFNKVVFALKESLSSFLTLVTPAIYTNSAIFLIGFYSSTQDVGYMQIGTKVSLAFCMLNTILTNVFYPMLNRKRHLFSKIKYIFLCFGLLFSVAMYFTSEFLLQFWIPNDNINIIETVKLLSPSPFLSSVISTFGINGLLVYKKDKLFMTIITIGSVSGLFTAFILIPFYSYIGGSISIIIALSITALLSYFYYAKTLNSNQNEV